MTTFNADMQQKFDPAATWTANDTVLREGEIGWEDDTGKIKIGDGVTAWTALPYIDESLALDLIPYDNGTSGLTATDAQAAIDEVSATADAAGTLAADHIVDAADAHDGAAVSFDDSGFVVITGITDVQAALAAVDAALDDRLTEAASSAAYAPLVKSQIGLYLDNWLTWDTFNRANGAIGTSDSAHAWSALSGTWTVASNRATQTSGTATAKVAVIDPAAGADGAAQVRCTHHAGGAGKGYGVVFRAIDNTNYLYADVFDDKFRLSKLDGGAFTNYAISGALTIEPGQPVIVAATFHSDQIDATFRTLSGRILSSLSAIITAGDLTKFGAQTKVGLINFAATTVTYDNFVTSAS